MFPRRRPGSCQTGVRYFARILKRVLGDDNLRVRVQDSDCDLKYLQVL